METVLLCNNDEQLQKAAEMIKTGLVVGIPTETVYGLGADALNENAVRSIFAAKGRPADNPLIVHLADFSQVHNETAESFFVEITELESLAERFQMNLEGMPVLEGGCSPLIKYTLFFYKLIKEFIDEFYRSLFCYLGRREIIA